MSGDRPLSAGRCERCQGPIESGDLRCAVCGGVVPAAVSNSHAAAATTVQLLRCRGCGSCVEYDAKVRAPRCAFCSEVQTLETLEDPPEEIEEFLPFQVDEVKARNALRAAFRKLGFFHPPDLVSGAKVQSIRPLWWVGWMFDAEVLVSWTADSDQDSRRSDWAPHSGQVEWSFRNIVVSASRGLDDAEVDPMIPHYDLATIRSGRPELDGATVERFDLQRSQARRRILQAVDLLAKSRVEAECVPGRRVRNVRTSSLLRGLSTRRIAFPAWVLAYRYRERVFRAVVHGQRSTITLADAPLSLSRVLLVVVAVVAALVLIVLLLSLGSR